MTERKRKSLLRFLVMVLFIPCLGPSVAGQSNKQPDDKETLQGLLTEVRMLRQALQTVQRMSLDSYRSQLMFERIRAYREDVRGLTEMLNKTRDEMGGFQRSVPSTIDQQKLLEGQIQLEVDQGKRAQLEFELRRAKDNVETFKSQVESLKEREQQLLAELNSEKAKLDELERRLDVLERFIESDRQKLETDKPVLEKKP
jgi:chromosome segregation ATPase